MTCPGEPALPAWPAVSAGLKSWLSPLVSFQRGVSGAQPQKRLPRLRESLRQWYSATLPPNKNCMPQFWIIKRVQAGPLNLQSWPQPPSRKKMIEQFSSPWLSELCDTTKTIPSSSDYCCMQPLKSTNSPKCFSTSSCVGFMSSSEAIFERDKQKECSAKSIPRL